jgi:FMN phosphatase YigB (HAD superfamily)
VVQPRAVIFDVGKVLFDWEPRFLYERLIEDDRALEAFLANVPARCGASVRGNLGGAARALSGA